MKEYVTLREILKIDGCKDVFCNKKKLIILDKLNTIYIEGLCTLPDLCDKIVRMHLVEDLLYLVCKDTTIYVINLIDLSIVGIYEGVKATVRDVIFTIGHINIITSSFEYYCSSYENICLRLVDNLKLEKRTYESIYEVHRSSVNLDSALTEPSSFICVELLSISFNERHKVYVDPFGYVYYNAQPIFNTTEDIKYIHIVEDKLYMILQDTLVVYCLLTDTVVEKKVVSSYKLAAGRYILCSNTIIDVANMAAFKLPQQIDNLFHSNGRLFFYDRQVLYEIVL